MTSEPTHRHLLAMMFTDIEGYSKIMNSDETLAIEILHFHNSFLQETIERGEGRVVEIIGDAFLAGFESAVRAVEAAIAIQEGLKQHNEKLPEEERFLVRIGIHMGDVIEETEGIKGDAVNIAARIQSIAPGGGIAISETIYNAVKSKMHINVVSLGERKLKNIQEPYKVYVLTLPVTGDNQSSGTSFNGRSIRKFTRKGTWKNLVIPLVVVMLIVLSYLFFFNEKQNTHDNITSSEKKEITTQPIVNSRSSNFEQFSVKEKSWMEKKRRT